MSPCLMDLIIHLFEEEVETLRKKINDLDLWWRNSGFSWKLVGI